MTTKVRTIINDVEAVYIVENAGVEITRFTYSGGSVVVSELTEHAVLSRRQFEENIHALRAWIDTVLIAFNEKRVAERTRPYSLEMERETNGLIAAYKPDGKDVAEMRFDPDTDQVTIDPRTGFTLDWSSFAGWVMMFEEFVGQARVGWNNG